MKTCTRFADMKAGYERDIAFLRGHAARHEGSTAAKASTRHAWGVKQNMARALAKHFERCPLCR
ncbi:hypothetical protein ACE1OC_06460 [Streptomyces sp. DSM 116496]|uniref:hypothetical protein n=1 Tax=Streptomyces stoeckheimensis TaxID=3344656 RepID=UPI0038B31BD3